MVLVYGRAQDEFVMVVNTPQCNKRNRVKSIIKNISFCGSVPKRWHDISKMVQTTCFANTEYRVIIRNDNYL